MRTTAMNLGDGVGTGPRSTDDLNLAGLAVGDPVVLADVWPGPGLYVVTEVKRRTDGDREIIDATLVDVHWASLGLRYTSTD